MGTGIITYKLSNRGPKAGENQLFRNLDGWTDGRTLTASKNVNSFIDEDHA